MTVAQRRLWEAIRIQPEKWALHPWGDESGGFWVVGLIGNVVVWFNEIEDGFNRSLYRRHGVIDEYFCNQDELEIAIQQLLMVIQTGYSIGGQAGPPEPI